MEAHKAAGEPLCEDCRRSAAKRSQVHAAKRRRTDDDEGYSSLADARLRERFDDHLNGGIPFRD
ncbi:hypothetical protein [Brachybacterium huguangmaarense]